MNSNSLLRQLISEEIKQLSNNLLKRLLGFIEEIDTVCGEVKNAYGIGTVWADRKSAEQDGVVKSQIEQLLHLINELDSLGQYINRQYQDKNLKTCINALIVSLTQLSMAAGPKGKLSKLFNKMGDVVEKVRAQDEEVQTRIRAVKKYVKMLQERSTQTPPVSP